MIEGIILILHPPILYPNQFVAQWGGYINLLFGAIVFVGFIAIAYHRKRETVKTIGAILAGTFSIVSFVLFGGGFYIGFILGLFGALLTAAKD
jgi:asparagine N-glycosylation enzyme membrane subunit Stt3